MKEPRYCPRENQPRLQKLRPTRKQTYSLPRLQCVKFEWNPAKARANEIKHGVDFERACLIFVDPDLITIADVDHSEDEDREISIGADPWGDILVVVHTTRMWTEQEWTRMISARRANAKEIEVYYLRKGRP